MNTNIKDLKRRLKDYRHFIITMLILSSYFYMGAVINTYLEPTNNGKVFFYMAFASIIIVIVLFYKQHKIKQLLEENEPQ